MARSKKAMTTLKYHSDEERLRSENARLCGILSRAVGALKIPWRHDDPLMPMFEAQISAFDKYLTRMQHGSPSEDAVAETKVNGVEIPFG